MKSRAQKLLESKIRKMVREELLKEDTTDTIDSELKKYFEELVPRSGPAETIEGEMIRAISRVIYRYLNDGDVFFLGYGKETVLSSVKWLTTKSPISKQLRPIFAKAKLAPRQRTKYGTEIVAQYTPMDEYNNAIYEAAKVIINYVKGKNGNYTPSNGDDSR